METLFFNSFAIPTYWHVQLFTKTYVSATLKQTLVLTKLKYLCGPIKTLKNKIKRPSSNYFNLDVLNICQEIDKLMCK
jgi:hypothetical protein